jgi:hypothetical protein
MTNKNTELRKGFHNEESAYDVTATVYQDSAYSKVYCETANELSIDARGDRVCFTMREYRIESQRQTGVSLTLSREEWNQLKKLIIETGGEL